MSPLLLVQHILYSDMLSLEETSGKIGCDESACAKRRCENLWSSDEATCIRPFSLTNQIRECDWFCARILEKVAVKTKVLLVKWHRIGTSWPKEGSEWCKREKKGDRRGKKDHTTLFLYSIFGNFGDKKKNIPTALSQKNDLSRLVLKI